METLQNRTPIYGKKSRPLPYLESGDFLVLMAMRNVLKNRKSMRKSLDTGQEID